MAGVNSNATYAITFSNGATATLAFEPGIHHNIVHVMTGGQTYTLNGDCQDSSTAVMTVTDPNGAGPCAAGSVTDIWTFSPSTGSVDSVSVTKQGSCTVSGGWSGTASTSN